MSHTGPILQISEHQAERWQVVCSKTHGKNMWQQKSKPRYGWIKISCLSPIPTALVEEAWLETLKYKISTPCRINNTHTHTHMHIHTHTHKDPYTLHCKGPINEGEGGWDSNSLENEEMQITWVIFYLQRFKSRQRDKLSL